jgi:DNA-binding beta-propeller fold protein YncE
MTVLIDNGPQVTVFVSNVLNGTVARIDLHIGASSATLLPSSHLIASGYAHRPDAAALVIGPTGLAYDAAHDVLYVASTNDNKVFALSGASSLALTCAGRWHWRLRRMETW